MAYLFKLVDKKGLIDARNNIISLSRPIFEFKGSEGKFINFAKRIYDKYSKKGIKIKPSETDLKDIKDWIEIYKKTYGKGFNDQDINSESMIIFCLIMQSFCGYFTMEDLSDSKTRMEYCNNSNFEDKIAIIKIDEKIFDHLHWRSTTVEGPYTKFYGSQDDYHDFNGFMHPTKIIYSNNFDDYHELLTIYNNDGVRHSKTWFNILSKEFEWQKEKRLLLTLRSLEPNSARVGCNAVYTAKKQCITWEEVVYGNIVDAIDYCVKGPQYVYLQLNKDEIEILDL